MEQMDKELTIQEVSRLSGLSEPTLRGSRDCALSRPGG